MTEKIFTLDNNIQFVYKNNENTPRTALCLNFSINKPEIKPGIYTLMARLLTQGTKNYDSEQLANEFEKFAIDFSCEFFPDYLRVKFLCLNEDFARAIELMYEVLENSTFEEYEKEKVKLAGEIQAELDSPKFTVMDNYAKTIFENHYYGHSVTKIRDALESITKNDVIDAFNNIINNSKKVLVFVGDLSEENILPLIRNTIEKLPKSVENEVEITTPVLDRTKNTTLQKADLNQAHIAKGWLVPTYNQENYAELVLLNIILGACGLSSRLFLELRDKKGLAYVVRSSYERFNKAGNFMIYIATEPNNIDISLKGFDEEIQKIKSIPVSEEELNDAKNNFFGKCAFVEETNLQQACLMAKYAILGLGHDFSKKAKEIISKATPETILACAKKYFTDDNFVLSVIKPQD